MHINLLLRFTLILLVITGISSGCAKQPAPTIEKSAIGPYSNFSGRLIIIEPKHRWQVSVQWRMENSKSGDIRLTHAATGTVVELHWSETDIKVRSSQTKEWKLITMNELHRQGIVVPPQQLASILLGRMPSHYAEIESNLWESRDEGSPIRLQWTPSLQKLTMTDIKHGRMATLIIQP